MDIDKLNKGNKLHIQISHIESILKELKATSIELITVTVNEHTPTPIKINYMVLTDDQKKRIWEMILSYVEGNLKKLEEKFKDL